MLAKPGAACIVSVADGSGRWHRRHGNLRSLLTNGKSVFSHHSMAQPVLSPLAVYVPKNPSVQPPDDARSPTTQGPAGLSLLTTWKLLLPLKPTVFPFTSTPAMIVTSAERSTYSPPNC